MKEVKQLATDAGGYLKDACTLIGRKKTFTPGELLTLFVYLNAARSAIGDALEWLGHETEPVPADDSGR